MGAKARQAKGKARLSAYEQLLAEANDAKDTTRELEIAIPPGPRLGDQVIEVKDLRKGYGDRLLIEDLTFSLPRAGIVGIIGPNGAGKTTLFRMLVGQEAPDAGSIEIGDTVQLSYVDQSRDDLDADKTVFQEITQGAEIIKVGTRELPARAYVSSFNFRGTDQQKLVGQLSGGERNRVHLAKLLQSGGNVAAARRADERPRRRHAARARGRPRVLPRLRRRHQPRSLVPGPDRDPHPRLRGRQPGPLVRGQRQRLRGVPPQGAGHGRRPAAPDPVQATRRVGEGEAQLTSCVIWSMATVAARMTGTSSLGPISTP